MTFNAPVAITPFLLQLLQVDPAKRPTAAQAAQHPWIRGETPLDLHMTRTIKKLREFNARRKFRVGKTDNFKF
jgi:serine/threonine protein kinase